MTRELAIRIISGEVLGTNEQTHEAVNMAIEALKSVRVRGEWIYNGLSESVDRVYCCSICGVALDDYIMGAFYNYCPNCGADMRGEE